MLDLLESNTIYIYFKHLVPCKQRELLAAFGIQELGEMNWDAFPIFEVLVPEDIDEETV